MTAFAQITCLLQVVICFGDFFFFSHNKEFRARDVLLETFSGKMSPKSRPLRQFPGKDTSMKCW